jgi:hypothetical protein
MLPMIRSATLAVAAATLASPALAQFDLRGVLSSVIANTAGQAAAGAAVQGLQAGAADPTATAAAPAAATAVVPSKPPTAAELEDILKSPVAGGDLPAGAVKGNLALKGKRYYLAEYRVLFEVAGRVTANTRAAYLGGIDRGGTRVTVNYSWPAPNIALMQAITDRAYADFLQQLAAAGIQPEPADTFVRELGAVYEATLDGTRPGAEVHEEQDLGHGTRKYMVFVPTGTKMVARGFIGIGAGNIGKRIEFSKSNVEGLSFGAAINLAAQESSGTASSLFKRGSSANASAAMEIVMPPKHAALLQGHALGQGMSLAAALPVPGQFAVLQEAGGYDSSKDAAVRAVQVLGALTLGVAGNNSKRVDMTVEVDQAALARQAFQGLAALHKATAVGIQ